MFLVLLALLLCAGSVALFVAALWPPIAVITVTPRSMIEQERIALVAVTTSPTLDQVPARMLTSISPEMQATVLASGVEIQPARVATGFITFFNLAPYAQVVGLGTVLTASAGIQVRTLQEVLVPAGNAPVQGSATVPAQALQPGTSGNLPIGAITASCCAKGILARNMQPFTGGEDPGNFTIVQQHDIDSAAALFLPQVQQAAQHALQANVLPAEQLVAPPTCRTQVQSDHPAGSQASTVTVSVTATCWGEVFDRRAVEQFARTEFTQQIQVRLGTHFQLEGVVWLAAVQVVAQHEHGILTLSILASGLWIYQLNRTALGHLLAGKPRNDATALLARTPGILHATISGWNAAILPTDPAQIQMVVVAPHQP